MKKCYVSLLSRKKYISDISNTQYVKAKSAFDSLLNVKELNPVEKIDKAIKSACRVHLYVRLGLNRSLDIIQIGE